jgi:RecG-like helicase
MMTATPIPRTLAMSYYADLDVSTIDELPPGRTPVVTKVVSETRRDEVIERIRGQLADGRQVYWVCPLIEESEALDLSNATATHEALSAALPGVLVGLRSGGGSSANSDCWGSDGVLRRATAAFLAGLGTGLAAGLPVRLLGQFRTIPSGD